MDNYRNVYFVNPIKLKEAYGIWFDFIGFYIEANYDRGVLVNKMDYCIVHNGKVIENDTLTGMWGRSVDEYFRNNILVTWGEGEEKLLRDMLLYHKISGDYLRIIKISDIALARKWPMDLKKLESRFKLKNSEESKSFRYAALLCACIDSGVDVRQYGCLNLCEIV